LAVRIKSFLQKISGNIAQFAKYNVADKGVLSTPNGVLTIQLSESVQEFAENSFHFAHLSIQDITGIIDDTTKKECMGYDESVAQSQIMVQFLDYKTVILFEVKDSDGPNPGPEWTIYVE
jgi:hypothetical protein